VVSVVENNGPLAGGTLVTIRGANFPPAVDSVLFGGRRLERWYAVSDTRLVGYTPPGAVAGPVDVTVYATGARTATCATCFTYNPAIVITAIGPDSGTIDGGTPVTITGVNFPAQVDSVRLGLGLLGELTRVSDTELRGITPSAPWRGSADLTVFSVRAGTAACAACFVYGPSIAVAVERVTPSSGALGGGTLLTITGANFPAGVDSVAVGGGRLLNVVRLSDSVLTGTAPATLTPGYASVVVYGAGSGTCVSCYKYEPRLDGGWKTVEAGDIASCGLNNAGAAYCWGSNVFGVIGGGGTPDRHTPAQVGGGITFASITSHGSHACGLTPSGAAYCWGAGQQLLPDGQVTTAPLPTAVGGGITFESLSAGDAQTCGVTAAGTAYCWGANGLGELGDGTRLARFSPVPVTGGILFARLFTSDFAHTCGVAAGGQAFCWGYNAHGELGFLQTDTDNSRTAPTAVSVYPFTTMALGMYHTCALTPQGQAICWGFNDQGQLGNGTRGDSPGLVAVATSLTFVSLVAGGEHTCGLTDTGAAYCWGDNYQGDLGDGTGIQRSLPVAVLGGIPFVRLSAGNSHTCGVTSGGAAYCWGDNQGGALGIGTTVASFSPALVPNP
jgi:alpha-tubulin suppressor-like RCC1 family protein